MRSKSLNLDTYATDKVEHGYFEVYDPLLAPWVESAITLLEIGVDKGGSLLLWKDYFPLGNIVGIDLEPPADFIPGERVQIFKGRQEDEKFLSEVALLTAPDGFDIIIDDASHVGTFTEKTFWHLFDNHLKPGGLYAIEDWGTGYWEDWPDGRELQSPTPSTSGLRSLLPQRRVDPMKVPFPCHSFGMVGFVKQLVDEQAAADVSRKRWTGTATRTSKFAELLITPSIVFVRKRSS